MARSSLSNKARRAELEEQLGSSRWHSSYYHRQFEDYTETSELSPSGRIRTRRVYVGPYFQAELSDRRWALQKWLYLLLIVVSFALYFGFAYPSTPANRTFYVTIFQAVALFGYIFLVWFSLGRLFAPRLLERRKLREAVRDLHLASLLLSIALGCCALATLAHFFLSERSAVDLAQTAAFAAAGACTFVIYLLEGRIQYTCISNKNTQADVAEAQEERVQD